MESRQKNLKGFVLQDVLEQSWKLGDKLGSGGFGSVYAACKNNQTNENYEYAVKVVSTKIVLRNPVRDFF